MIINWMKNFNSWQKHTTEVGIHALMKSFHTESDATVDQMSGALSNH